MSLCCRGSTGGASDPRHCQHPKNDHYPSDDHFGRFNYVETGRQPTAELVYHLSAALGVPFDADLGTWIYSGIAFDTGRFRFSSTTANALRIAGEIVGAGANPQLIAEQLFYEYRLPTLSLLALTLQSLEMSVRWRLAMLSPKDAQLSQAPYRVSH